MPDRIIPTWKEVQLIFGILFLAGAEGVCYQQYGGKTTLIFNLMAACILVLLHLGEIKYRLWEITIKLKAKQDVLDDRMAELKDLQDRMAVIPGGTYVPISEADDVFIDRDKAAVILPLAYFADASLRPDDQRWLFSHLRLEHRRLLDQ